MKEEDYRQLSELQHFYFCKRQWALIHLENAWKENDLTAKGRITHERAHNDLLEEVQNDKMIVRGMHVKSDLFQVVGICDVVEFIKDPMGIQLAGRSGKWSVNPVEYKRGHCKGSDCDRLQLCGQVICLEEMLCCTIPAADLFYGEPHRRERVPMTDELRDKTKDLLKEMQILYKKKHTPKVKYRKRCDSCSLKDLCLPKSEFQSVKKYLDDVFSAAFK